MFACHDQICGLEADLRSCVKTPVVCHSPVPLLLPCDANFSKSSLQLTKLW